MSGFVWVRGGVAIPDVRLPSILNLEGSYTGGASCLVVDRMHVAWYWSDSDGFPDVKRDALFLVLWWRDRVSQAGKDSSSSFGEFKA